MTREQDIAEQERVWRNYARQVLQKDIIEKAFNNAIKGGTLTVNPSDNESYAGRHMYMYSDGQVDYFKHTVTREYKTSPVK
jgi:hypothetical protein